MIELSLLSLSNELEKHFPDTSLEGVDVHRPAENIIHIEDRAGAFAGYDMSGDSYPVVKEKALEAYKVAGQKIAFVLDIPVEVLEELRKRDTELPYGFSIEVRIDEIPVDDSESLIPAEQGGEAAWVEPEDRGLEPWEEN